MNPRVLCMLGVIVVASTLSCARDPVRPGPGDRVPVLAAADVSPEWSHDGSRIAYHRRLPSADGPAGLYIISANGGKPRLLAPGQFVSPAYIRFSPDDRFISCVQATQLLIVDVFAGAESRPMYTANGVTHPDWSPDGRSIVYSRWALYPNDPRDSLGLHILDLSSGQDRPVYHEGQVQFGRFPVWFDAGAKVAFIESVDGLTRVSVIQTDGSSRRALVEPPPGRHLGQLRRHVRNFRDGLAFDGLPPLRSSFVDWDGSRIHPLPRTYRSTDAYSPDGSMGVGSRVNAEDSTAVLFVFRTDDLTGVTYRQLTHYTR